MLFIFMDANQKFVIYFVRRGNEQLKSKRGRDFLLENVQHAIFILKLFWNFALKVYLNKNLNFCQGSLKWITTMSTTHFILAICLWRWWIPSLFVLYEEVWFVKYVPSTYCFLFENELPTTAFSKETNRGVFSITVMGYLVMMHT